MRSLTQRDLAKALEKLLPSLDATVPFKAILVDLAAHLGVEMQELRSKHKDDLKQLIPDMIHLCKGGENKENEGDNEEQEDEEEDVVVKKKPVKRSRAQLIEESDGESSAESADGSGESEEDEEVETKRRKKAPRVSKEKKVVAKRKTPAPRKTAEKLKESEGMAALKELCRVAGLLNPSLYATLKKFSSDEDREEALRERLREGGIRFTSPYPTKGEISAAKRKREKERELDGIDTSLIITGGRSRRSGSQPASYTAEPDIGDEDEDENQAEEDQHDDNEEESEPNDGSEASDESEAEF